jgi:hypothetical protein
MSRSLSLLLACSSLVAVVAFAPAADACSPGQAPFGVTAHPAAGTHVPANFAGVMFRSYQGITGYELKMFDSKGVEVPSEAGMYSVPSFGSSPFVSATVELTVGETYFVRGTVTGYGSQSGATTVPAEGSFVAAPAAGVPKTLGAIQVVGSEVSVAAPGFEAFQGFAEFEIAAYEPTGTSYWPQRGLKNTATFPMSCDGDLGDTCAEKMAPGSRRLEAKAFIPGLGEVASAQSTTADLTCASPRANPFTSQPQVGPGCNTSGQSGSAGSSLFLTSLVAALVVAARRRNARG